MQQHHVETIHVQNMQGLLSSQLPLLHCESMLGLSSSPHKTFVPTPQATVGR